jgi:[ribosomal protein S18]-alanine N-acetyltransferase
MVRRLQNADLARAAVLQRASFAGPFGLPLSTAFTEAQFADELVRHNSCALAVANADGLLVGTLVAWFVADEFHLHNIAVDPAWRRNGYAKQLLDALLAEACARQIRVGYLEVEAANVAAIELYRQWGAHALNVRRGYYHDGGDALEMRIFLDSTACVVVAAPDEI